MGWFKRREPVSFTLPLPRPDGASWTFEQAGAVRDFAARTTYESGYRNAFDPPAPEIAQQLITKTLSALETELDIAEDDRPYVTQMLTTAAQIGAGLASVDPDRGHDTGRLDPALAGALLLADDDLPTQTEAQRRAGRFLIQAGHYVARQGEQALPVVLARLHDTDGES